MPTRPWTALELRDSAFLLDVAAGLSEDSSSDESLADCMLDDACEPFVRRRLQEIGPETLSIARLQREANERGFNEDDVSSLTYTNYMFGLSYLPVVVNALDPPAFFRTVGDHVFSGEEGVLLLLRRYRTLGSLDGLTKETGRSGAAISEAVSFMAEYIEAKFPWLVDERSLSSWAPHFEEFADAFARKGVPSISLGHE